MRRLTRYLWGALLFLGTTLVFWGMLQNQGEPDNEFARMLALQGEFKLVRANGLEPESKEANLVRRMNIQPEPTTTPSTALKNTTFSFNFRKDTLQPITDGPFSILKLPEFNKIWPEKNERLDRIITQIHTIAKNPKLNDREEQKLILIYNGYPQGIPDGRKKFMEDKCPVNNCQMTEDRERIQEAHAVVIQSGLYNIPSGPRNPEQIWILYVLESPQNIGDLTIAKGHFNWTATYRLDSTINTPYERFVPFKNITDELPPPKRNYAEGKTKKVAWFVSNCYTANGRLEYAKELQRHISVDIYGECGNHRCSRNDKKLCNQILNNNYKFYLAFENSNCRDYITEKFYWNGLYNDILPIVMGARPEDYAAVAPPHSYIHVDEFESPAHLAEYLYTLDENDTLYNEYFRWKSTGEFIDTKYWCRLCSLVHEAQNNALKPQEKFSMWYGDVQKWWNGPGICVHPRQNDIVKWSSWRNLSTTSQKEPGKNPDILHFGPWPVS